MDRFDAMRMFVRVVESGSFSAVARETGVGQPSVSKQIAQLEAHLGAQLMRRTSRSMSLTEAGQTFYESAVRLVDDLAAAESLIGRGQTAPSGLVRATIAPVFARLYVVPRLPEFFARYPDISVELLVSERTVNLIEEGVDLAVHNGELLELIADCPEDCDDANYHGRHPSLSDGAGRTDEPERPRAPYLRDFHSGRGAAAMDIQGQIRSDRPSSQRSFSIGRCRTDTRGGACGSRSRPRAGLALRARDRVRRRSRGAGRV